MTLTSISTHSINMPFLASAEENTRGLVVIQDWLVTTTKDWLVGCNEVVFGCLFVMV